MYDKNLRNNVLTSSSHIHNVPTPSNNNNEVSKYQTKKYGTCEELSQGTPMIESTKMMNSGNKNIYRTSFANKEPNPSNPDLTPYAHGFCDYTNSENGSLWQKMDPIKKSHSGKQHIVHKDQIPSTPVKWTPKIPC